ncbi:MAG: DUF5009 domain-containing protein [Bacteroidota bacterium]
MDIFRGITIAGMIVVNDAGDWGHIYTPLHHAEWHGITPTDFVFPFFLFIVGVAITLSFSKLKAKEVPQGVILKKVLRRTLIIYGLGVFLWLWPNFDFSNIRLVGVLHRIAFVYLACSLIFLRTDNWKSLAWITGGLLVGYWGMMTLIPVPIDETIQVALDTGTVKAIAGMIPVEGIHTVSEGFIAPNLEPGTNLQAYLDRLIVPGRLYQYSWDPEGFLSTIPAIATGLSGILAGKIIMQDQTHEQKVIWLLSLGFLALTIGNMWDWFFPFNKNLWTSSYVMYTSGLALMSLGALYWFVDIKQYNRGNWTFPFKVFGSNAIAAYALHSLLNFPFRIKFGAEGEQWTIISGFLDTLTAWGASPEMASFLWALVYTLFIYVLVWGMYKRGIFLKI